MRIKMLIFLDPRTSLTDGSRLGQSVSDAGYRTKFRVEYHPTDLKAFLLPLWAAYPSFTSVTMGWRQSYGEQRVAFVLPRFVRGGKDGIQPEISATNR